MKRKTPPTPSPIANKKSKGCMDPLLQLNDENVWVHEIFSFLSLEDHLPVLLTCSTWNRLLIRSNSFLFLKLCLCYQRFMPLPSLQFFQSQVARELYAAVSQREGQIVFDSTEFEYIEQEDIVREIMKTMNFDLRLLPQNHPSQDLLEEWDDLTELYEFISSENANSLARRKRKLKLVERLAPYIFNAVTNLENGLGYSIAELLEGEKELLNKRKQLFLVMIRYSTPTIPQQFMSDRNFVLQLLRIDGSVFQQVSHLYCNDREMIRAGLNTSYCVLQLASNELRSNRQFALAAVHINPDAFRGVSTELADDQELFVIALKLACKKKIGPTRIYMAASQRLQNDPNNAMLLMSFRPFNSYHILSPEMQRNRDVALQCPSLDRIPPGLENDRDICLKVIREQQNQFCSISSGLLNDKLFAIGLAKWRPQLIERFPPHILGDREVLKIALPRYGSALFKLSEEMQKDKELIMYALQAPDRIFKNLPLNLRSDKEFVKEAIHRHVYNYIHCSSDVKEDREIALLSVKKCGALIEFVPDKFKNDPEFVTHAVNERGYYLKHVSENLRDNKEIVLQAVKKNASALEFASKALQKDEEVIAAAKQQFPQIIEYLSTKL